MISEARRRVAAQVAKACPSVPVHQCVPARLDLPAILITEGTPFITTARFGTWSIAWRVLVIARPGDNSTMIGWLDDTVSALIDGIDDLTEVEPFATMTGPDGQLLLTCALTITTMEGMNP